MEENYICYKTRTFLEVREAVAEKTKGNLSYLNFPTPANNEKYGEVRSRTKTIVIQAHRHSWLMKY